MDMATLQRLLAQQGAAAPPETSLQFKAGRLTKRGTTVTADPAKGLVRVQTGADGVLKLQWESRPEGTKDPAIMLFPGTATMEGPIDECKDGRVLALHLRDSNKYHFFWMQEPSDKKDTEIVKKINDWIANPPPAGAGAGGAGGGGSSAGLVPPGAAAAPGMGASGAGPASTAQMNQAEFLRAIQASLAQSFSGSARPSGASGSSSSSQPAGAASAAAAQNPEASRMMAALAAASAGQIDNEQQYLLGHPASLAETLSADRVAPLLDEDVDLVRELAEHLPEGQTSREAIEEQLRSPQLRQTYSRLQHALTGGQYAQIMSQFGLPVTDGLGVEGFFQALQQSQSGNDSTEDKDEDMPSAQDDNSNNGDGTS